MKKLLSLLGIVLILSTLLITFASCGVEYYVPADNVEEEQEDTTTKSFPKTEKEKRSIYDSAMSFLAANDWISAYNYFLQIPDYEDVPEYLAGFSYQAQTLVIRDITEDLKGEGTQLYNISTTISDYGYFHGETLTDYSVSGTITTKKTTVDQIKVPDPSDDTKKINEKHGRPEKVSYPEYTFFGQTIYGYTVNYVYANENSSQVKTEKIYFSVYPQALEIHYTYNENKSIQKINITWPRDLIPYNYEFQYVYNNGKLTQIKFVDLSQGADPTPVEYANYTYNAKGQLTSITYPGGSVDPIESLKTYTGNKNEWTAPVWDEENAYTITYTYNAKGQRATEILNYKNSDDKDQTTVYEKYNSNGILEQKTVTMKVKVTVDEVEELQLKTYRYNYTQIKLCYDPLS